MGNHNLFCILVFLLLGNNAFAQTNPYVIYFKNKQGSSFTTAEPLAYLSVKSVQRRILHNIPIDSADLPVSESHLTKIRSIGATIVYTSKWLNAAYIKADDAQYDQILSLSFVQGGWNTSSINNHPNTQTIESVQTSFSAPFSNFIGIPEMHNQHIKGDGVLIAITDSGFPGADTLTAFSHLWNGNKIKHTWDVADNEANVFNDHEHGTCILSILAAQLPDYTGVAPNADYLLLRTEVAAFESIIEEFHWLRAAEIADSCGADIISCSLGYTTYDNSSSSYSYSDMNGKVSIIAWAADKAFNKGILIVCSAGNDGNNHWKYIGTPGDAQHALTIGSVDSNNEKSPFSSIGPSADGRIKPELCARGSEVYCLNPSGSFQLVGGTSMSTPMIAGLAAGIKQQFPSLTNHELKSILIQSGDQYLNPDNEKGYGVPHYQKIAELAALYTHESSLIIAPNPYSSGDLLLKIAVPSRVLALQVFDLQGKLVYVQSWFPETEIVQLSGPFHTFTAGMYFFHVQSDSREQVIKWIKL